MFNMFIQHISFRVSVCAFAMRSVNYLFSSYDLLELFQLYFNHFIGDWFQTNARAMHTTHSSIAADRAAAARLISITVWIIVYIDIVFVRLMQSRNKSSNSDWRIKSPCSRDYVKIRSTERDRQAESEMAAVQMSFMPMHTHNRQISTSFLLRFLQNFIFPF